MAANAVLRVEAVASIARVVHSADRRVLVVVSEFVPILFPVAGVIHQVVMA